MNNYSDACVRVYVHVQVAQLAIQLIWTRNVTEALRKSKVDPKIMSNTMQSISDLLNLILGLVTANESAVDRIRFESLAVLQTHYRDTFNDLVSRYRRANFIPAYSGLNV